MPNPSYWKFGANKIGTVIKFGGVGLVATVTYFAFANLLIATGLRDAKLASFVAYLSAAAVSYFGHKILTFQSSQPHKIGLPRFILTTVFGSLIAYWFPKIVTEQFGQTPQVAFGAICLIIPILNYFLFKFWVFAFNKKIGLT